MRKTAFLLVAAVSFLGPSGAALAERPQPIFPHQHFIVKPDGTLLPVGPDICTNEAASQGFFGFHQNVHTGSPNLFAFGRPNNPVGFRAITNC
jgi:hypothetical protein